MLCFESSTYTISLLLTKYMFSWHGFFLKKGKGPGAFEKGEISLRFIKKGEKLCMFNFLFTIIHLISTLQCHLSMFLDV